MNETGLILKKKLGTFDEGAYGPVFFLEDGKAIKVYKKHQVANEDHTRKTFESETKAYVLASASDEAQKLVPRYFGPVTISQVVSSDNRDITGEYYPDLNFAMDLRRTAFAPSADFVFALLQ